MRPYISLGEIRVEGLETFFVVGINPRQFREQLLIEHDKIRMSIICSLHSHKVIQVDFGKVPQLWIRHVQVIFQGRTGEIFYRCVGIVEMSVMNK